MQAILDNYADHPVPAKRPKNEYIPNQAINNYFPGNIPRFLPPTTSSWITPQKIHEYLRNPSQYECIVHLFFPKSIQKSYQGEKR